MQSDPPGALVYLNDEEIGRTPVQRDFLWYGTFSVAVRKDGYKSIKTTANVPAPFYQWPPIDLFAELLPFQFTDHHELSYTLDPQPPGEDNAGLLDRALSLRGELESSHLPAPATRPSKSTTRRTNSHQKTTTRISANMY